MCGIFGIYNLSKSKKAVDPRKAILALEEMKHRGPDAHAIKVINENTLLGHLRLSIIDLSENNNQPFCSENGNYVLSYNGEIYNYVEIRNELIDAGFHFVTAGDTEVLLKAYQHWGKACLSKFNGMWAFAIYDVQKDQLFCARDRFGVKPFCYTISEDQFIFSSEIKSIIKYTPELRKPNYKVISSFCRTSVGAQHAETWFEGILRLQPSHCMEVDREGIKIEKYWDYPDSTNYNIGLEEAKAEYLKILEDAVRLRMRSDVPVGTTLSSGIDSNSIVCLLRQFYKEKHDTYTAYFETSNFDDAEKKNYKEKISINEADLVKRIVDDFNLSGHFIKLEFSDFNEQLLTVVRHLESGHASPAIIPLNKILIEARKDVVVVLEGQGADELLGGYINNNFFPILIECLMAFRFRDLINEWREFAKYYSVKQTILLFFRSLNNRFPILTVIEQKISGRDVYGRLCRNQAQLKDFPDNLGKIKSYFNRVLARQHAGGLVDLLHYGDAISMANSLESRLPFMDYRLVEYSFTLPYWMKMKNGLGKYIHRVALENIVPDYILKNPLKFGFNTPISEFFKDNSVDSPVNILLSEQCLQREIFDREKLMKLVKTHQSGKRNHSRLLFRLYQVELWFRTFID